jgi:UV DNA damage repair endonuclease
MRIGYACINMTLPSKFKTCRLATFEKDGIEKIKELTLHNLHTVLQVLHWNVDIHQSCQVPICFDIHHHICKNNGETLEPMLDKVFDTWQGFGIPKMHISSGKTCETDNSHHDFIFKTDYDRLIRLLDGRDVDIMFEAKQKEKSVLRIREELMG